jgi:hypothetical protein
VDISASNSAYQEISILEPTPDGLAAWFVHIPRRSQKAAPVLENGSGRFYVIVRGELQSAQQPPVGALSVIWTAKDEKPLELQASDEDLDVIIVQFPKNAW